MEYRNIQRNIKPAQEGSSQWRLYHLLGRFVKELDRLPDAAKVRKSRPRSRPASMIQPLF